MFQGPSYKIKTKQTPNPPQKPQQKLLYTELNWKLSILHVLAVFSRYLTLLKQTNLSWKVFLFYSLWLSKISLGVCDSDGPIFLNTLFMIILYFPYKLHPLCIIPWEKSPANTQLPEFPWTWRTAVAKQLSFGPVCFSISYLFLWTKCQPKEKFLCAVRGVGPPTTFIHPESVISCSWGEAFGLTCILSELRYLTVLSLLPL